MSEAATILALCAGFLAGLITGFVGAFLTVCSIVGKTAKAIVKAINESENITIEGGK